jgi:hypothetical protein
MSGRVPPSSRAHLPPATGSQVRKVARLFERFTGHDAAVIESIDVPELPDAVAVIGPCDAIEYTTVRDGQTERYRHTFRAADKPLMCVTPDGVQILLVGGRFRFTSRGIVDASDKKHANVR